jgi:aquaporin Z
MATTSALPSRIGSEFLGTFWLVLGGCGTAVLAATFPETGVGFLGVAVAFGLTVLTMAYAVGHVSGAHFNPAVTVGLAAAHRFPWRDVVPYVLTQVVAAFVAAGVLYVVADGRPGFEAAKGRAPVGFAPLAIGLALTLIHLISIPVTNTSVNPARSTGVAPFAGSWAMTQLWLFWVAPLIGAAIAGVTYAPITGERITAPVKGETRASAT